MAKIQITMSEGQALDLYNYITFGEDRQIKENVPELLQNLLIECLWVRNDDLYGRRKAKATCAYGSEITIERIK